MIIDSSAIIAILEGEKERDILSSCLEKSFSNKLPVTCLVETSIVIESRYPMTGRQNLEDFLDKAKMETVPVSLEVGLRAQNAFRRFGKGRHKAALNFGDCFSYATAIELGEPLLCKGDDFIHTDVMLAWDSREEAERA